MCNLQFSFSDCIENKGNFKVLWLISSIRLMHCRRKRTFKVLVRFVKTVNFSKNHVVDWNCNSTVPVGDSYCQLASRIWNSGGGPPFKFVSGASQQFLQKNCYRNGT